MYISQPNKERCEIDLFHTAKYPINSKRRLSDPEQYLYLHEWLLIVYFDYMQIPVIDLLSYNSQQKSLSGHQRGLVLAKRYLILFVCFLPDLQWRLSEIGS